MGNGIIGPLIFFEIEDESFFQESEDCDG